MFHPSIHPQYHQMCYWYVILILDPTLQSTHPSIHPSTHPPIRPSAHPVPYFFAQTMSICIFVDCCKQSFPWLYHPSIHPLTHPSIHSIIHPSSAKVFCAKNEHMLICWINALILCAMLFFNFKLYSTNEQNFQLHSKFSFANLTALVLIN